MDRSPTSDAALSSSRKAVKLSCGTSSLASAPATSMKRPSALIAEDSFELLRRREDAKNTSDEAPTAAVPRHRRRRRKLRRVTSSMENLRGAVATMSGLASAATTDSSPPSSNFDEDRSSSSLIIKSPCSNQKKMRSLMTPSFDDGKRKSASLLFDLAPPAPKRSCRVLNVLNLPPLSSCGGVLSPPPLSSLRIPALPPPLSPIERNDLDEQCRRSSSGGGKEGGENDPFVEFRIMPRFDSPWLSLLRPTAPSLVPAEV